jgi:hypothetical protein
MQLLFLLDHVAAFLALKSVGSGFWDIGDIAKFHFGKFSALGCLKRWD